MTHSTFTNAHGLTLAYADEGEGVPVLCLAGLTRNMEDFEPVLPHLLTRARVIRLDSRGRGGSDHDPDYRRYSVPHEARDAIALLDHLGVGRAVLIGTSRGGIISMLLAATHKDRLRGVVLNDIGPVLEPLGLSRIMDYLGRPPVARTLDAAAAGMVEVMAAGFPDLTAADWRPHVARWYAERPEGGLALRYDARLRDAMIEQAAGPAGDLWPLFTALAGLPVAVIRGALSDLLSRETVAAMARNHPGLITAEVPNRAHVPFLDEPEAIAAIDAVLDEVISAS